MIIIHCINIISSSVVVVVVFIIKTYFAVSC